MGNIFKEPAACFPGGLSHSLPHKLIHPAPGLVVTETFLQDTESASAGDGHSGLLLPAPMLLPPLLEEQRGQCGDCHKQPWATAA